MEEQEPLVSDFDVYKGDGSRSSSLSSLDDIPVHHLGNGTYRASDKLIEAVNLAICVAQPLLVTGEPGCGKTRLAYSVAEELGIGEPFEFHTKSTSRAQDLLYNYDAVRHFKDIQLQRPEADDIRNYIAYGALGRAIVGEKRAVVLIDEIDKAPRDFPNDLLSEIDRMQFDVTELPENERRKKSNVRPIVIVTSNSERQLPLPFLRRCIFHHITFPEKDDLIKIVEERLSGQKLDPDLIRAAVEQFARVRDIEKLTKKPATGELLSWMVALNKRRVSAKDLARARLAELPLWQALIKDRDDYKRLQEASA